jgi:uncharacterized paraquat-inducible protein A
MPVIRDLHPLVQFAILFLLVFEFVEVITGDDSWPTARIVMRIVLMVIITGALLRYWIKSRRKRRAIAKKRRDNLSVAPVLAAAEPNAKWTSAIYCPRCGEHLQVDTNERGGLVNCPRCAKEVTIPKSRPRLSVSS